MVLSPELLDAASSAARRLEAADREVLLARADYHGAVRRLHLGGGSLREIAQALSLSHQRVQQIVSSGGGSWWRRMWRTRRMPADASCTWCGRPPGEVARLIAGPKVFICDACVASAEKAASGHPAGPFTRTRKRTVAAGCAFCRKRANDKRSLIAAEAGHVCTDCLTVCREILAASS